MSQRDTLRSMDAALHAAFIAAGLADTVVHQPATGGPVTRRGYVDQAITAAGFDAQVTNGSGAITLLRADGPDPRTGDTLTVDGDTYTVDRVEARDESRVLVTVTRG